VRARCSGRPANRRRPRGTDSVDRPCETGRDRAHARSRAPPFRTPLKCGKVTRRGHGPRAANWARARARGGPWPPYGRPGSPRPPRAQFEHAPPAGGFCLSTRADLADRGACAATPRPSRGRGRRAEATRRWSRSSAPRPPPASRPSGRGGPQSTGREVRREVHEVYFWRRHADFNGEFCKPPASVGINLTELKFSLGPQNGRLVAVTCFPRVVPSARHADARCAFVRIPAASPARAPHCVSPPPERPQWVESKIKVSALRSVIPVG
jgi:hypothetical protein